MLRGCREVFIPMWLIDVRLFRDVSVDSSCEVEDVHTQNPPPPLESCPSHEHRDCFK